MADGQLSHPASRCSMNCHLAVEAPRGGLAPGKLRRVREYIETHVGEQRHRSAGVARGIVRASFRQSIQTARRSAATSLSAGAAEQRIQKAAELLKATEEPLASIALSVGFADQSHFSRSFHWLEGQTSSQFRRAHR